MFMLYVLLVPLFKAYGALLYTDPGHNVTIQCLFPSSSGMYMSWYKQTVGEKPKIMSSFYKHSHDGNKFYNEYKDNKRFSVHAGEGFYHLRISNVQDSDSAMYYCGQIKFTVIEFDNGTFLVLKESSRRSLLLQPASDSVEPGGSVSLNCTVRTGTINGEHSVYWLKTDSANMGITYIHSHGNSQCVQSPRAPAQSCVYSLLKRNVSLSDAGTYYCALASCGGIKFGAGTRLHVREKHGDNFPVWMICVVVAPLAVILNIILIGVICKISRKKTLQSAELTPQSNISEYTPDSLNEESDALQYVALDFKKRHSKSRKQKSTQEDTIYSGLRPSDKLN